jgi:hypothetical protein
MKRILFIYLLFFTHIAIGQERTLSDSAQISLLTCSPGEELYSAFGHTGIRVTDFKNEFDVVFNYGTFDFEQPGFYTNFIRGRMLYCLAVDRYDNFRQQYIYEGRRVEEQILNLNTEDKKKYLPHYSKMLKKKTETIATIFSGITVARVRAMCLRKRWAID